MRYRSLLTTSAAFLAVVLSAGLWIGVASRATPGQPGLLVSILGGVFAIAFVSLLVIRLRALLARPERRLLEGLLLLVNLAILIVTFAWVHHWIGIMDLSGIAPRVSHDFSDAIYFSIVTSTTLGYGDFVPLGPGRPIAALQALLGYLILGILVSSGYQIIAPHTSPGQELKEQREAEEQEDEREEDERDEEERDEDERDEEEDGESGRAEGRS